LISVPDSTSSKTFKRWQGSATVTVKKSPHSYIVKLNGSKHKIHANQLRKFYCRVYKVSCIVTSSITASCNSAIRYKKNSDFGQVIVPETTSINTNDELPSKRIGESKLAHLKPQQKAELLSLLDKYTDCFSDVPGFIRLFEHAISLLVSCRSDYRHTKYPSNSKIKFKNNSMTWKNKV